jgi:hypothetical protein
MLVCDGAKRWRRHGRGSSAESQSGGIVPKSRDHGDWTAVRPRKFHVERIASVAKREMSTNYGVV